jgi:hypothetical protein
VSAGSPAPDFGEVRHPGLIGRWLRRPPRIVREANFAAALATLPAGATVERTDPRGHWIVYLSADGRGRIRFRASEAWLAAEPTIMPNKSNETEAAVHADGNVVVYHGLHRTRGTARHGSVVREDEGGVPSAPGWLDYALVDELPPPSPATRAIMEMMGGDPDAPPVPAR